ncbi:SAM-dependent methyltransferase [Streptomyces yaanensis]|uniref:SAM-dependent methyltransferase n=1 Tax=Streptomyces yaanensis TaxID=1142239 RepID=A0ABV7SEF5_9ACTN|nr:SAM-dependent methyltransferase [Streptomyces sp. CGMCC 4.7035]WNB98045.1 SAM-dependent methyltransferase [Streptomyces sp. CGMCC 4.7035]
MTPTAVRQHHPHAGPAPRVDRCARARDWAEIQERMLVPLYEAVYERLEVGSGTRLLGLGCGSGLALLMAVSRGASVTGVHRGARERLALARERLMPETWGTRARAAARLVDGRPQDATPATGEPAYNLVCAFEPIGCVDGDLEGLVEQLAAAMPLAEHGSLVVLTGWGPPERCSTSSVLRVAAKPADPERGTGNWRPARRDDLEEAARRSGLRPDGSGRVACPFGYADLDSAVRGMLSTGFFDGALDATDQEQVDKELTEALHPHQRADGTVWMPNVFRYLIARIP